MLDHRYEDLLNRIADLEQRLGDAIREQPVVIETAGPGGEVVSGFRQEGNPVRRGVIELKAAGNISITDHGDGSFTIDDTP